VFSRNLAFLVQTVARLGSHVDRASDLPLAVNHKERNVGASPILSRAPAFQCPCWVLIGKSKLNMHQVIFTKPVQQRDKCARTIKNRSNQRKCAKIEADVQASTPCRSQSRVHRVKWSRPTCIGRQNKPVCGQLANVTADTQS